jgi:hypothetical protein
MGLLASSEDGNRMIVAEYTEMGVKGKDMINTVGIINKKLHSGSSP